MKFLWYDSWYVNLYINTKYKRNGHSDDPVEKFDKNFGFSTVGSEAYKELYKINQFFSKGPWGMLHDITNHVAHPFNIQTKTAYNYNFDSRSFGEVCLDVAKTIANQTNKPIAINWSGGIDSTSVLVAMLQVLPRDRITVVCNQNSIDEYPEFYRDIIQNQISTLTPWQWSQCSEQFYTLGGDAGDTVWGALDDTFWTKASHRIDLPWKTWLESKSANIDFVQEFCSWSQVPIETVLDLRIWFYLCCKWQDKAMRIYTNLPGLKPTEASAFFDWDNSFQNWTMSNLDKIIGTQWNSYKMPAKQFIYEFHKDSHYRDFKTKENSVSLPQSSLAWKIKSNSNSVAIDENFDSHNIKCWPFVDQKHFEDWNDQCQLIPMQLLQAQ